jgi:Concanavalin A-like lectin/glucanases superfamily
MPWPGPAGNPGVKDCIGGTVTYSGGNTIHTFTNVGSNDFLCPTGRTINYLVIAGGGAGGGASYSGGGGAGGLVTGTGSVVAGVSTVVVGAGGTAAAGLRGGSGGSSLITTPGGAGSWFTIMPSQTNAALGSAFTGYALYNRYSFPFFTSLVPTGTQMRVTIANGAAGANTLNSLYCGHAAANQVMAVGNNANYDGNQVQIKFSGSGSVTVPAAPLVSDPVNFNFDKSRDLICSGGWGNSAIVGNSATGNNLQGELNIPGGAANAGNTTNSGTLGAISYSVLPILTIEVFSNATIVAQAVGGGGGGQYSTTVNGASGGSGGGGSYGATAAAAGTAGQGFAGGWLTGQTCGSAGGGAGAVGGNCIGVNGGNGGAGLASSISGVSVTYAGGGAGGPYTGVGGTGGAGGGGNGGNYSPATACTPGASNTGGGGGGIASTGLCNGGSGVVIISYITGSPNVNCVGGTITTVGSNTVHTFASAGTAAISCATGKSVNYLVVGGGGWGGSTAGTTAAPGGGGAGGLLQGSGGYVAPGVTQITVGAGSPTPPAYNVAPCSNGTTSGSGGSSILPGVAQASGGGNGGCTGYPASSGGSGGGDQTYGIGSGISGQGTAGGSGPNAGPNYGGGGGGGCGAIGSNGTASAGGNGGTGCSSSISGVSVCYAGGGAGAITSPTGGTPGVADPNCGGGNPNVAGTNGRGGGGGGASATTATVGTKGGDGIVIVSYVTDSTQPPPPCTPNTDGGGTFANVQALFHFDGNGNDVSGNGRNWTITAGAANFTGTTAKFGLNSYQGAASSYATMANIPPGMTDVTIETWLYFTSTAAATVIANYPGSFEWYYNVLVANNQEMDGPSNSPTLAGGGIPPLNAWHHYAWVRASGVWKLYIDGVSQTLTGTQWTANVGGSGNWLLGFNTGAYYWNNGFIDEMRISNVARYTTNFTPQITAFCNN